MPSRMEHPHKEGGKKEQDALKLQMRGEEGGDR